MIGTIKKIKILLLFLFVQQIAGAQITCGKIVYERKTNLYKKYKDGFMREWIKEEDKNKVDVFELYFNDSLAAFKPQESDLKEKMSWTTSKNSVYQNFNQNKRLTIKSIWGEQLYVQDSLCIRKWKMTESKRTICGYLCRKAIWEANDSTRLYAWYCNEINVSTGPESFIGLPGIILGLATEDGGVIYFAKTVEVIKYGADVLLIKKTKNKIYTTSELRTKLEKEFGKEKWGKEMIHEAFDIW
ncbi:MAG TPA: GLPGLI family protein [Bacteroidia bacterium]|nr:GLPGLI family protein [Bacteroidia bacterium]